MDFYCIERGTLLDNPSIVTLEQPNAHSVHCLVDVPSCYNSPFEVLLDPPPGQRLYTRGFRLDDASKELIIDLARNTGGRDSGCSTCMDMGDIRQGFRAAVIAEVLDLNEGEDIPPTISVTESVASHDEDNACSVFFDMMDLTVELANSNKTIGIVSEPGGRTKLQKQQLIHGSLMLIGWGILLPAGAIFAKLFKHRPDGLWFKIHQACVMLGLIFAIAGWSIALRNFDVFSDKGYNSYRHGIMGVTTMCLGLLQPLNAALRPHPPAKGEEATPARKIWEMIHKGTGYAANLLAVCTIALGTSILPKVDDQKRFQLAYGIGAGGLLLIIVIALNRDKKSFPDEEAKQACGDDDDDEKEEQRQKLGSARHHHDGTTVANPKIL